MFKFKKRKIKRKAFTLVELLIVIAIIGILFIVLISKVDFATNKSKATGVQTDFRSFQVAIETVAKEHAGLATFGWDTGDTNGDRIRNSYDKGDLNKNGQQDEGEVFVGSKAYGETWTNIYTLTNPADANDTSAIIALESAINANLDPKLHVKINDDLTITMANGAQDPWNIEYHGAYISNAVVDGKDRGAIVMYSNGANQEFGSEHSISNGVVGISIPGNNIHGQDDYSLAVIYTYVNGYGEVKTKTSGFSVNQGDSIHSSIDNTNNSNESNVDIVPIPDEPGATFTKYLNNPGCHYAWDHTDNCFTFEKKTLSWEELKDPNNGNKYGYYADCITDTSMDSYAFESCVTLASIHLPEGIEYIDYCSFVNCISLTSVKLPDSLIAISSSAFEGCVELRSIVIPDNVEYIADYAFAYCFNLQTAHIGKKVLYLTATFPGCENLKTVTFSEDAQLEYIGDQTFYYCFALKTVTLPTNLLEIGYDAFSYSGLEEISIPDGCIEVYDYAFSSCQDLRRVTIGQNLQRIGPFAFRDTDNIELLICDETNPYLHSQNNNILVETDAKRLVLALNGATIPDDGSVEIIGSYAFYGRLGINSITIPHCITSIEYEAFKNCFKLAEVINLSSLDIVIGETTHGYVAYYAEGVPTDDSKFNVVNDYIFATYNDVNYLIGYVGTSSQLTFPMEYNGEKYIVAKYAFYENKNITSINMSDAVTNIHDYAFYNCSNLTNVNLSSHLIEIGAYAFSGCSNVTSFNLPYGLESISEQSFAGCDGLTYLFIPQTLTYLGGRAFWGSDNLISVVFDDCFINISAQCFYNCVNLTTVDLGDNVSIIWGSAFHFCDKLSNVKLSVNLKQIQDDAFWCCYSLTTIDLPDGLELIGEKAFFNCSSLKELRVPNSVTSIERYAFEGCTSMELIELPFVGIDATANKIFGYVFGATSYQNQSKVPQSLKTVIINGGEKVGGSAFYTCEYIEHIVLNNVPSISNFAMAYLDSLKTVVIGDETTSIGRFAFEECKNLEYVYFSTNSKLTALSDAFMDCTSLKEIYIPTGVTSLSGSTFEGCTSLKTVTFGENSKLTSMGIQVFENCTSLEEVIFPEGLTSMGYGTFGGCVNLKTVVFPSTLESIPAEACYGCTSLENVTIGHGPTRIIRDAFTGCSSLTSITYVGTMEQWNSRFSSLGYPTIVTIHCLDGDIIR